MTTPSVKRKATTPADTSTQSTRGRITYTEIAASTSASASASASASWHQTGIDTTLSASRSNVVSCSPPTTRAVAGNNTQSSRNEFTVYLMDSNDTGVGRSYVSASASATTATATIRTIDRAEIIEGVEQGQWELENPMPYKYLIETVLSNRKNHIFVGKVGETICSLFAFRFTGRPLNDATIALLWTQQNHRNKGYFTRLLYAATPFLLDDSHILSGHSTTVHSQHQLLRSQNWNEVTNCSNFWVELRKLRQIIEEKCSQKSTGLNNDDDWGITLNSSDTDGKLAVYNALPMIGTTTETSMNRNNSVTNQDCVTLESSSASSSSSLPSLLSEQQNRGRRSSSRTRTTRQVLNMTGKSDSYNYDYSKASEQIDELEGKGRDLWNLSLSYTNPDSRFLQKCPHPRAESWCFYPSKHHDKKLLFAQGTQGVHYALSYKELGRMSEEYRLLDEWPNLPSSQADERTTINVVNNTTDKCSGNNNNNNDNANGTESVVSVVKMEGNNDHHDDADESKITGSSSTSDIGINSKKKREEEQVETTCNEGRGGTTIANNNNNAPSVVRQLSLRLANEDMRQPFQPNKIRLQQLEKEFYWDDRIRNDAILERLQQLEKDVYGRIREAAFLKRLETLETDIFRLQRLEKEFYGNIKIRKDALLKRLQQLEKDFFGTIGKDVFLRRLESLEAHVFG